VEAEGGVTPTLLVLDLQVEWEAPSSGLMGGSRRMATVWVMRLIPLTEEFPQHLTCHLVGEGVWAEAQGEEWEEDGGKDGGKPGETSPLKSNTRQLYFQKIV
jgi:hypothetical protein